MKISSVVVLFLLLADFASASDFYYQPTPGAEPNLAFGQGVSSDGSTAFGFINGELPGYIWTAQGDFETIDAPPELTSNRFRDVSADGTVLLGSGTLDDNTRSYLWSFENGYQFLPAQDGGRGSILSDDGSKVYGYQNVDQIDGVPIRRYWSWSEQAGYEFLIGLDSDVDLNLGSPQAATSSRLFFSKGVYDFADGSTIPVPQPIEGRNSLFRDASHDGSIAVGRGPVDNQDFHAIRWQVGSDAVEVLGTLDYPNHTDSMARGVSADGKVIVGVSNGNHPDLESRAFVWDERNGMRELEDVFRDEYGMQVHPWGIGVAEKISDDRRTIVGSIREGRRASGSPGDMWVARLDWPLGSIRSDFDLDDVLDADDADLLVTAILNRSGDPLYDLDADGTLGLVDLDNLLTRAGKSNGDANFDGKVDFADFLVLSDSFGRPSIWSQGDFDASGATEFADFLILSNEFGTSGEAISAVPEPTVTPLFLVLVLASFRRRI